MAKQPKDKRSRMWNFFKVVNDDDKTASCNYCSHHMSYRSTISNLKTHIRRKHPDIDLEEYYTCDVPDEECQSDDQNSIDPGNPESNNADNGGVSSTDTSVGGKQPRSREKRSRLWNFFKVVNDDNKTASCNYCFNHMSYRSTVSNLKHHLERKHPDVFFDEYIASVPDEECLSDDQNSIGPGTAEHSNAGNGGVSSTDTYVVKELRVSDGQRRPQKKYVLEYVPGETAPLDIVETADGEPIREIKMEVVEDDEVEEDEDGTTEDNRQVSERSGSHKKIDPPEPPGQQVAIREAVVKITRNSLIDNAAQKLSRKTDKDDPIYVPSGQLRLYRRTELNKRKNHLLNNSAQRFRSRQAIIKSWPSSIRPLPPKFADPRRKFASDRGVRRMHQDSVPPILKKDPQPDPESPIYGFFKSMAAVVATFPPHLIAETRLKVCKLVTETELRAMSERNMTDPSSSSLGDSLPVISRVSSASSNSES